MRKGRFGAKVIMIILFVAVTLVTAGLTSGERSYQTVFEQVLHDIMSPVQSGLTWLSQKTPAIPHFFRNINEVQDQNLALIAEISQLKNELALLEEMRHENAELRSLLGIIDELAAWQPQVTSVIGRSRTTWYRTITINGGTNQGFAAGMPVVNEQGVVGRILAVAYNSAQVLLLTDKDGAVSAMIQDNRIAGIIESVDGKSNKLQMIYLPLETTVIKDQVVITSGLGGIYPKGLRIGYVDSVERDSSGLTQTAQVTPFVDFSRLEKVIVLKNN